MGRAGLEQGNTGPTRAFSVNLQPALVADPGWVQRASVSQRSQGVEPGGDGRPCGCGGPQTMFPHALDLGPLLPSH
jgi:hypothetical protein